MVKSCKNPVTWLLWTDGRCANCKEVSENGAPTVFIPTLGVILLQHHSERNFRKFGLFRGHQQSSDLSLTKMTCDKFYTIHLFKNNTAQFGFFLEHCRIALTFADESPYQVCRCLTNVLEKNST